MSRLTPRCDSNRLIAAYTTRARTGRCFEVADTRLVCVCVGGGVGVYRVCVCVWGGGVPTNEGASGDGCGVGVGKGRPDASWAKSVIRSSNEM